MGGIRDFWWCTSRLLCDHGDIQDRVKSELSEDEASDYVIPLTTFARRPHSASTQICHSNAVLGAGAASCIVRVEKSICLQEMNRSGRPKSWHSHPLLTPLPQSRKLRYFTPDLYLQRYCVSSNQRPRNVSPSKYKSYESGNVLRIGYVDARSCGDGVPNITRGFQR